MNNSEFKKYHGRLRREGILKSIILGLAAGFVAMFLVAFVTWFFNFKGLFLTLDIFLGVWVLATLLLYFLRFKPTEKAVARRVDGLGLDERLITMIGLRGDDNYIAVRQREDAEEKLNNLGVSKLKFTVSMTLILLLVVIGMFAFAMTAVTGLSDFDIIPTVADMIHDRQQASSDNFIDIIYEAGAGGEIFGETNQTIMKHESTTTVVAVAKEGYRFYMWTDGCKTPSRSDVDLTEDTTFTARFLAMDKDNVDTRVTGDEANDQPPEDGNDTNEQPGEQDHTGDGEYHEYNYVIDGVTYYRGVFDDYYEAAMEELASDGEMSDAMRDFLEAYFNSIKN